MEKLITKLVISSDREFAEERFFISDVGRDLTTQRLTQNYHEETIHVVTNGILLPLEDYIDCEEEFLMECSAEIDATSFWPSSVKAVRSLCMEGSDLRKRYLDNANCNNKNEAEIISCFKTLQGFQSLAISSICKELACFLNEVEKFCGRDARIVYEEILSSPLEILNDECHEFPAGETSQFVSTPESTGSSSFLVTSDSVATTSFASTSDEIVPTRIIGLAVIVLFVIV